MSTLKTAFSQPPSTPPSAHNCKWGKNNCSNGCAESNGNLLSPSNVCRKTFTRKDALRCPKDVYGQPSTYRWKTEYDQAYNLNDDVGLISHGGGLCSGWVTFQRFGYMEKGDPLISAESTQESLHLDMLQLWLHCYRQH